MRLKPHKLGLVVGFKGEMLVTLAGFYRNACVYDGCAGRADFGELGGVELLDFLRGQRRRRAGFLPFAFLSIPARGYHVRWRGRVD